MSSQLRVNDATWQSKQLSSWLRSSKLWQKIPKVQTHLHPCKPTKFQQVLTLSFHFLSPPRGEAWRLSCFPAVQNHLWPATTSHLQPVGAQGPNSYVSPIFPIDFQAFKKLGPEKYEPQMEQFLFICKDCHTEPKVTCRRRHLSFSPQLGRLTVWSQVCTCITGPSDWPSACSALLCVGALDLAKPRATNALGQHGPRATNACIHWLTVSYTMIFPNLKKKKLVDL